MVEVHAGVHLYDTSTDGGIWVYLPLEKANAVQWWVDTLTVFPSGEVKCGRVVLSERYLTSLFLDLYV